MKKEIVCSYLKRNAQEGTDFRSRPPYVNFMSDFAFLPVKCFQSFSCAKKEI